MAAPVRLMEGSFDFAQYPAEMVERATQLGMQLIRVWEDQRAFNSLFREPPQTDHERAKQIRDFVLFEISEQIELLRTVPWKAHRRAIHLENRAHQCQEAADIFKCVMSQWQILNMTPEELFQAYWDKTAVVRQRYQEEWVQNLDGPCAVVDIDSVLANYIDGICEWLLAHCHEVEPLRIQALRESRSWVNARSVGMPEDRWQWWKHTFRLSGAKRRLPVYPDAHPFLARLRDRGLRIVLLTSRPIDRYPNLYTDTLLWLQENELPFDFIWWSNNKAERVLEGDLQAHVQLVVDDDLTYINQFASLGLPCYWLTRTISNASIDEMTNVQRVSSLTAVLDHYDTIGRTHVKHP